MKSLDDLKTVLEVEEPGAVSIIERGHQKLDDYFNHAFETPVYMLSIGEWLF